MAVTLPESTRDLFTRPLLGHIGKIERAKRAIHGGHTLVLA